MDAQKHAAWTALQLACTKAGADEAVALLLKAGASPLARNKDGWNAVHVAARTPEPVSAVRLLINADPRCLSNVSNNGRSPLMTASLAVRNAVATAH